MSDLAEIRRKRLAEIVDSEGLAATARRFQKPDRQINDMIAGRKSFGEKVARAMEASYDPFRPSGWLDRPAGETPAGPPLLDLSEHPDIAPVARVTFKLAAGVHGYAIEPAVDEVPPIFFRRDWLALKGYRADKLVAVKVAGQSMEPGLFDGDLVVINMADAAPRDGEVFAVNYEGELGIKRMKRDAGEWWLASDNQDKRRYPDKRCNGDVTILGRIIYKQSERV